MRRGFVLKTCCFLVVCCGVKGRLTAFELTKNRPGDSCDVLIVGVWWWLTYYIMVSISLDGLFNGVHIYILVGGWPTPSEKYECQMGVYDSHRLWEITFMLQTTTQYILYIYMLYYICHTMYAQCRTGCLEEISGWMQLQKQLLPRAPKVCQSTGWPIWPPFFGKSLIPKNW